MAKKKSTKALILTEEVSSENTKQALTNNKINDLLLQIVESLLDDNKRLKFSLDRERRDRGLQFGGGNSHSRKK